MLTLLFETNRKPDWREQASSKKRGKKSQCGWKRENNGAEKEIRREKKRSDDEWWMKKGRKKIEVAVKEDIMDKNYWKWNNKKALENSVKRKNKLRIDLK